MLIQVRTSAFCTPLRPGANNVDQVPIVVHYPRMISLVLKRVVNSVSAAKKPQAKGLRM